MIESTMPGWLVRYIAGAMLCADYNFMMQQR